MASRAAQPRRLGRRRFPVLFRQREEPHAVRAADFDGQGGRVGLQAMAEGGAPLQQQQQREQMPPWTPGSHAGLITAPAPGCQPSMLGS